MPERRGAPNDAAPYRSLGPRPDAGGFSETAEPTPLGAGFAFSLTTQAEALDQVLVTRLVLALDIVKQPPTLTDHNQEATPGVKIFLVGFQMVCEVGNALREDRYLDFWGTRVPALLGVLINECCLAFSHNRHRLLHFMSSTSS